jgi:hypothetical protein
MVSSGTMATFIMLVLAMHCADAARKRAKGQTAMEAAQQDVVQQDDAFVPPVEPRKKLAVDIGTTGNTNSVKQVPDRRMQRGDALTDFTEGLQSLFQGEPEEDPFEDVAPEMNNPGSPALFGFRAKTEVTASTTSKCQDVKNEIIGRANGDKGWVDPHNGGTYEVLSGEGGIITTQRTANPETSMGGYAYVDKQTFTLAKDGSGCRIFACSESQGPSGKDFSTNYCNLRNLYCGTADGCQTILKNIVSTENSVTASSGQSDFSDCIVAA